MYKSATDRRKSVFAEPYNPDEDDGDEAKVEQYDSVDTFNQNHLLFRLYILKQTSKELVSRKQFKNVFFSKLWMRNN